MHGSNRLGCNSLTDLLVFGRRAGMGAIEYLKKNGANPVSDAVIVPALKLPEPSLATIVDTVLALVALEVTVNEDDPD
jgi:succinate dehydrogenase/fumarate reductase flavoprotein subunit